MKSETNYGIEEIEIENTEGRDAWQLIDETLTRDQSLRLLSYSSADDGKIVIAHLGSDRRRK